MRSIHDHEMASGGGAASTMAGGASTATDAGCTTIFGENVRRADFRAHDTVVMEGDPARSVFEVIDGAVMLYKLLQDGRRQVVELLGPGDVFGFSPDLDYDCSAECLVRSRIAIVPRQTVQRCPELQGRLASRGWAQVRALHSHAVLLGRKSAMERVASFLEGLARTSTDDAAIRLTMTRQEIADYLGLTIETVSRSFSELRRRGIVTCERQDLIRIPDLDRISVLTGT